MTDALDRDDPPLCAANAHCETVFFMDSRTSYLQNCAFEVEDEATALLILQIQIQDINVLILTKKGKGHESDFDDADLAMAAYQGSLRRGSRF